MRSNSSMEARRPRALIIRSVVALLWTGCLQTGLTAMHTAAQFGQQEFVRLMLAKVPATITTEPPQADSKVPATITTEPPQADANNPLLSVNSEVCRTSATFLCMLHVIVVMFDD